MPQLAPIVITDNQAVDHTYNPNSVNVNGMSTLIEGSQSQRNLAEKLTISQVPIKGNAGFKTEVRITVPRVVTADDIESVLETDTLSISFTTRPHSDETSRSDLRVLAQNSLADGSVIATMIDKLEQVW